MTCIRINVNIPVVYFIKDWKFVKQKTFSLKKKHCCSVVVPAGPSSCQVNDKSRQGQRECRQMSVVYDEGEKK